MYELLLLWSAFLFLTVFENSVDSLPYSDVLAESATITATKVHRYRQHNNHTLLVIVTLLIGAGQSGSKSKDLIM